MTSWRQFGWESQRERSTEAGILRLRRTKAPLADLAWQLPRPKGHMISSGTSEDPQLFHIKGHRAATIKTSKANANANTSKSKVKDWNVPSAFTRVTAAAATPKSGI